MIKLVEEYLAKCSDIVNENANKGYSIGGLILNNSSELIKEYWLNLFGDKARTYHCQGDIYIHDLGMLSSYCAGWSLKDLIIRGIESANGYISSAPAKHFSTILGQIVNFIGILQNEHAGAQSFSSFDTYLAPFVRKDRLTYEEVYQELQQFIFSINIPSRWGMQCPFSNITLDWSVPKDLADEYAIIGNDVLNTKYSDYQEEMDMIDKALMELYLKGDKNGRIFTFPIPTINLTNQFDWDSEKTNLLFDVTGRYGIPYFQNFINSDLDPSSVHAMCCRLQIRKDKLREKTGGIFGFDDKTGSIGVVTINLGAIGYRNKNNIENFWADLNDKLEIAYEILMKKREIISLFLNNGLYPYTKVYLKDFSNHYSTIGVIGGNECVIEMFGKSLKNENSITFMLSVLSHIKEKLLDFQNRSGVLFNLEATPAETACYKLAQLDKTRYVDCFLNKVGQKYYTNSTHLPVDATDDIFNAIELQEKLQCSYTGGTVFHTYIGEAISGEMCKSLVKKIAYNYKIPYFSITPTFSVCPNCGYIIGECFICKKCGEKCDVYSRIVGYYRPVKYWNDGKKDEFSDRITYNYRLYTETEDL